MPTLLRDGIRMGFYFSVYQEIINQFVLSNKDKENK